MGRRRKVVFCLLFSALVILTTLNGSRSIFLALTIYTVCILLSLNGVIELRKRHFILGIIVSPLLALSFLMATFLRDDGYDAKTTVTSDRVSMLKDFSLTGEQNRAADEVQFIGAALLFDRAGFLSYAAEVITNHDQYSAVVNFEYYLKSIVDNLLTPGFDIFEIPRASNAFALSWFS